MEGGGGGYRFFHPIEKRVARRGGRPPMVTADIKQRGEEERGRRLPHLGQYERHEREGDPLEIK